MRTNSASRLAHRFRYIVLVFLWLLLQSGDPGCGPATPPAPNPCENRVRLDFTPPSVISYGTLDEIKVRTPAARKTCHADYTVKFRWANEERARTDGSRPPMDWMYGVEGSGIFGEPSVSVARMDGMYLWTAYLSQGSKNNPNEYVHYVAAVSASPLAVEIRDAVWISGYVMYTPYTP